MYSCIVFESHDLIFVLFKFLISNLYKHCKVEPLSARVDRTGWRMLCHVLRGPTDGSANSLPVFAINI